MKSVKITLVLLAVVCAVFAQEETTVAPVPTTANPGLPIGSFCNGVVARCNRHGNTVACLQRRTEATTPQPTEAPISENPIISILKRNAPAPREVCETGAGVDLGRCQCSRNCKNGQYVEDGEFDDLRDICVGLVGSTCSIAVSSCTVNGHCNYLAGKCVCDAGYHVEEKRCVKT